LSKSPPPPPKSPPQTKQPPTPPQPPPKKVAKPPQRPPPEPPKLPLLQKKGRGKIWAGIILFILGFILTFVVFRGMGLLPFVGVLLILAGVYALYKGFTEVDKVLTPEPVKGRAKPRMVYKEKKNLNKGAIFLIIIFIFFMLPIFLTIFQFGNVTTQPYSVYNGTDEGCSILRQDFESSGYETTAIISSYSELSKLPADYPMNHTILFIIGPKALFFPTELIQLSNFLAAGGIVIILQDDGTANEGLFFLGFFQILNMQIIVNPFDLPFQDGYLCRGAGGSTAAAITVPISLAGSTYNVQFWTASPLGGTASPFSFIDSTSSDVWLDANKNLQQDPGETTGSFYVTAVSMTGNLILISDPDIFTNKIMQEPVYQNRAFASALINSLTGGDLTWRIMFDEAHQVKYGYSASFYFGLIVAMEDFVLLSWLFAPLGPYMAYKLVKRFIPEAEKPEKIPLSKVKREGESLYKKRLDWFKSRHRYDKAIVLLYRRLKRTLTQVLKMKGFDVNEAIDGILKSYPEGEVDEKRLVKAFEMLEEVEKEKRIAFEEDFLKIFLEMRWIADLATPTTRESVSAGMM
jgi:hypothetical protein